MKSTGIVRKIDELGRIVVPIELRRTLGVEVRDAMEIFVDGDQIILKKYKPNMTCVVTGEVSDDNLVLLDGKLIVSEDVARQLITQLEGRVK